MLQKTIQEYQNGSVLTQENGTKINSTMKYEMDIRELWNYK
jgi:hypothetical protein